MGIEPKQLNVIQFKPIKKKRIVHPMIHTHEFSGNSDLIFLLIAVFSVGCIVGAYGMFLRCL